MIDLQRKYNFYNKKYFDGKLPTSCVVSFSTWQPSDGMAMSHPHGVLACDPNYCEPDCNSSFIRIQHHLYEFHDQTCMTLLHEMAHIEAVLGNRLLATHGPVWQARMLRLAKDGAFNDIW